MLQIAEAQQREAEAKSQQLEELHNKLRDLNAKVYFFAMNWPCQGQLTVGIPCTLFNHVTGCMLCFQEVILLECALLQIR